MKQLRDIVLAGFSNVYSIFSILAFTVAFSVWQGFKLTEGLKKAEEEISSLKNEEEMMLTPKENPGLPSTIIVFAILLFAFNLLQFYRNIALRFSCYSTFYSALLQKVFCQGIFPQKDKTVSAKSLERRPAKKRGAQGYQCSWPQQNPSIIQWIWRNQKV